MSREGLRLILRFAAEGPQAEQRGGGRAEEGADGHLRAASAEGGGGCQRRGPPDGGHLHPWLFCLNSV